MSEPLRTERAEPGPLSEADRAARVEQLLLAGLDQYFGGQYEQAIDIWTRVAFLERGHGRARAYIERARGALAERERESEEYLHNGVAAYQAGDRQAARALLTRAVEQGGGSDAALLFLQRLGRIDAATEGGGSPRSPGVRSPSTGQVRRAAGASGDWLATAAASVAVAGVILLAAFPVASWLREFPVGAPVATQGPAEPIPVVRVSEVRVRRARMLVEADRPHEALRLLDRVEPGDPVRGEADRLRAEIQQGLLAGMPRNEATTGSPVR